MLEDTIEFIDDYESRPLTVDEARQISLERKWRFFAGHEGQHWILAFSPALKVTVLILKSEYDSLVAAGLWERFWSWKDAIKEGKAQAAVGPLNTEQALSSLVHTSTYFRSKYPVSQLSKALEECVDVIVKRVIPFEKGEF